MTMTTRPGGIDADLDAFVAVLKGPHFRAVRGVVPDSHVVLSIVGRASEVEMEMIALRDPRVCLALYELGEPAQLTDAQITLCLRVLRTLGHDQP